MRAPLGFFDVVYRYSLPAASICALMAAAALLLSPMFVPTGGGAMRVAVLAGDEAADPPPIADPALEESPFAALVAQPMSVVVSLEGSSGLPASEVAPPPAGVSPAPGPTANPATVLQSRPTADLPIVMYHHVGPLPPNPDAIRRDLTVSQANFEGQLKYLADRHIATVYLDDLMEHLAGGAVLPTRAVVLTFDDGYEDNYHHAFSLLKKHGMVGTFFITTDFVGRPGYMSWDQLAEMADVGMSIQAHSVNHADLTAVGSAELTRQLILPKKQIEEHVGRPVRFLAYPSGKHNRTVIVATRAAGYDAAVTVNHGTAQSGAGPYELRRVRARGADSVDQLAARMSPPGWRTTARQ